MVVELYKKAKSLTYELAWEIAWKKEKKIRSLKEILCETAKGKCDTVRRRKKKKRKKNHVELTRDLISFNLYLIFYLPRYNVLTIFLIVFSFPLFSLSFVSFYVLSPGLLCRRLESFSRALPFTPVPFVTISLSFALYLSLFLLFYPFVSTSHSLILPFIFRIHIFAIRLSQMSASYLKKKTTLSMPFTLFLSLSRTRPTAKRQMANITYCKEIIIPQNELATC